MAARWGLWIALIAIADPLLDWHCYFSSLPPRIEIGQFARLLPSLEVVAISQAPSPEPNPDSPSPVTAMVAQYATIES